jgi:hypothetical protein
MRHWILVPVTAALFTAACGETTTQRATTGAAGGAIIGAVVGGPIGALVGAGIGGAGGAYKDEIQQTADAAVGDLSTRTEKAIEGDAPRATGAAIEPAERVQAAPAKPRSGLTNREVREAQIALREMGLYDGEIDGMYGRRTIGAVKRFQAGQEGMRSTGTLDEPTQRRIRVAASKRGVEKAPTGEGETVPAPATPR